MPTAAQSGETIVGRLRRQSPILVLSAGSNWLAVDKFSGLSLSATERLSDLAHDCVFARVRTQHANGRLANFAISGGLLRALDPIDGGLHGNDPGSSGAVVVAADRASAEQLAQLEAQRRIHLEYAVGVVQWPTSRDRLRLDQIQRALKNVGLELLTVESVDDRALIRLRCASGRLLSVRRELASLGVVIAEPVTRAVQRTTTPRLLLHRETLHLDGETIRSELPAIFGHWLRDAALPVEQALRAAAPLLAPVVAGADPQAATDCFRLLDGGGSGWFVDAYGENVVAQYYLPAGPVDSGKLEQVRSTQTATCARVGQVVGARSAWLQLRPRQSNQIVDAVTAGLAPTAPAWQTGEGGAGSAGGESKTTVRENGLLFQVVFDQGLATGLYLDQRDNRRRVREMAKGRQVLNTFSYTGGFCVAAATGLARRTVGIDASATAIEWARSNLELNGFADRDRHDLIRGDVMQWLPKLARRGDTFDMVILDPPSHAKVKQKRWVAAQDYPALAAMAWRLLAPQGALLACINDAHIDAAHLLHMVQDGARDAGVTLLTVDHLPQQCDFGAGRMKSILAVRA